MQWARWCRQPGYLLDDATLPLANFQQFPAPVLAYSFEDDDWGTRQFGDATMGAYPNLSRRHIVPEAVGLQSIGHFGYFRPKAKALWQETVQWLEKSGLQMAEAVN